MASEKLIQIPYSYDLFVETVNIDGHELSISAIKLPRFKRSKHTVILFRDAEVVFVNGSEHRDESIRHFNATLAFVHNKGLRVIDEDSDILLQEYREFFKQFMKELFASSWR